MDMLKEVKKVLESATGPEKRLQSICDMLRKGVPHYDWVGFYLVDPANEKELVLGPYSGAPTEHVRIGFGEGICGQAAERMDIFVVQDVSLEENYLACSPDVRSEIVVPVIFGGRIVGELDIDSHRLSPFTGEDRALLERICEMVAADVNALSIGKKHI